MKMKRNFFTHIKIGFDLIRSNYLNWRSLTFSLVQPISRKMEKRKMIIKNDFSFIQEKKTKRCFTIR